MLNDRSNPHSPALPDSDQLVGLMAGIRPAVLTVPALAEVTGWSRDRVSDAIAEAVDAGHLTEWPENPSGPAVMIKHPERFGLTLEVAGEADAFAYSWAPLCKFAQRSGVDDSPRDPHWRADRDRRRKAGRTMGEGMAMARGWERPLDSIPDLGAADPAMVAQHREELEAAIQVGDNSINSRIKGVLPAIPKPHPGVDPGTPHRRHEAGKAEERDSWQLVGHGAAWGACHPSPEPRRNVDAVARPIPIANARPLNLLRNPADHECPCCHSLPLTAAQLCLYCDRAGDVVDAVLAVPLDQLQATADREVKRIDRNRKAYEKAVAEKRKNRRIRDAAKREAKELAAMVSVEV